MGGTFAEERGGGGGDTETVEGTAGQSMVLVQVTVVMISDN